MSFIDLAVWCGYAHCDNEGILAFEGFNQRLWQVIVDSFDLNSLWDFAAAALPGNSSDFVFSALDPLLRQYIFHTGPPA